MRFAPHWGMKMSMPHFFKEEKIAKFNRHWMHRLGLEVIKIDHVRRFGYNPGQEDYKIMS